MSDLVMIHQLARLLRVSPKDHSDFSSDGGSQTPKPSFKPDQIRSKAENGRKDIRSAKKQEIDLQAALSALCILARLHNIAADPKSVAHQLGWSHSDRLLWSDTLLAARHIGFKAKSIRPRLDQIQRLPLPSLALLADGQVAILARCDSRQVLIQRCPAASPSTPKNHPTESITLQTPDIIAQTLEDFENEWSGHMILLTSRASITGEAGSFGFRWFTPSLIRHRRLLAEVFLISLTLQCLALVTPLFFQVVMDKVLVHRGLSTLDVLALGLVIVAVFESILGVLRTYLFTHTTSRVDIELGAKLFRHLLALPMAYFQARRVGDTVARVRELEQIRAFLTGNAMTLLLDLLFSVVFIAVMLAYSIQLTLAVLASVPMYIGLSLSLIPILRRRLDEKFARHAENQSLMVECVNGVQTVKSAALEPRLARQWDDQMAAYLSANFRAQTLANCGNECIQLVAKLVNAATLWLGAQAVMNGELTVGMFVAFNMLANRVSQPVLRIAQLWSDFQQTGLSMRRLADILNSPSESPGSTAANLPPLLGEVTLSGVSFRYRPGAPLVLTQISLDIKAGEIIGVVGRSGSGKSTLAKLVQRLHVPEQGRVQIDGIDLTSVDASQLRRQIGVVLQDSFLFNRSVRENIAMADPGAPMTQVVAVAKLAGAHEFITQLPEGYDTRVGEQGAALSGGQRQRIAIARALFTDPRVLIFDEATSALDYESEAALQSRMGEICTGRTVIIIAHRLSALRHASRIVVLEQGQIVEAGHHAELVQGSGLYARLWELQADARGVA